MAITQVPVDRVIWDKRVFPLKEEVVRDHMQSIKQTGLIHAVVMELIETEDSPDKFKLHVGRHRYEAIKRLYHHHADFTLSFCGHTQPRMTIPAVLTNNLSLEQLLDIQISENVFRQELSWQDKNRALALLVRREEEKAERAGEAKPTLQNIARKLADSSGGSEETFRKRMSQAVILDSHMDDREIKTAESQRAAWNRLKQKTQHQLAIAAAASPIGQSPHQLIVGDCLDVFSSPIGEGLVGSFDTVLADPPYGIGAHEWTNMKEHKYDDTWDGAFSLYGSIMYHAYRLCKDRANMFLFCSPDKWYDLRLMAEEHGWVVWPRPVIWIKSNEGMRPHGQAGFAYTYETILYATKGQKGLMKTHNDVLSYYRPSSSVREHAAAKPVELYAKLLELGGLPGDRVLDPCVGSGTTFLAAFQHQMTVFGIEKEEEVAAVARKNMFAPEDRPVPPALSSPADEVLMSLDDI